MTKDGECSLTFEHIENSLEHWVTFTYIINSVSVETRTALCIIHWKGNSKLLTLLLIKNLLFQENILVFNIHLFFHPILHHIFLTFFNGNEISIPH